MLLRPWLTKEAGLTGKQLERATRACDDNCYESVADLRAATAQELEDAFAGGAIRKKIERALAASGSKAETSPEEVSSMTLPNDAKYACFLSHKKAHSRFGLDSESLARNIKDVLKLKAGLEGFYVSCAECVRSLP